MPVVLRTGGFVFSFFAGDHDPPHVHVWYGGGTAVVEIESGQVRDVRAMSDIDLRRAQRLVDEYCNQLLAAWVAHKSRREASI